MHKILVIRLSALGDIIHAMPAITDLHRRWPQAHIDMAVDERFVGIPAQHPHLHRVIGLPLKRLKGSLFQRGSGGQLHQMLADLRRDHYDLIIDVHGLWKSALVTRLARGRQRVGFHSSQCAEKPAAWFYQRHYRPEQITSRVQWIRELVAFAADTDCSTPPDYAMGSASLDGRERTVVFFHSASRAEKLWPEKHWVELGQHLCRQGYQLELAWGNEDERQRAERLCRDINPQQCVIAPQRTMAEWTQRLGQVSLAVGLDSGLTHLAAAVGTPCAAIYISTSGETLIAQRPDLALVIGGHGALPGVNDVQITCDRLLMRLKVHPL